MTRIGGPKGSSRPQGPGASGSTGPKRPFPVATTAAPGASPKATRPGSFLADVRVLAEAVRDGVIYEDVALERLVQTAISRRVVGSAAGDATVVRTVTDIVKDDPNLAAEIRRLLRSKAGG